MSLRRLFWDNPELRRNLSLELTPGRLLWTPVFLVVAVGLCFLADKPMADLLRTAQWVVVGIWLVGGLVWGALRAAQSVRTERMERTWDSQRLTALSAGQFAVGKVFGAASHNLLLQAVLAVAWVAISLSRHQLAPSDTSLRAVVVVPATLGIGAIALYALMVAQSFLETDPVRSAKSTLFSFVVPLVATIYLATNFWPDLLVDRTAAASWSEHERMVTWWGLEVPRPEFQLATLCLLLGWAWLGLWRSLRRDLQEADVPWAWPAFLVFLGIFVQGFWAFGSRDEALGAPIGLIPLALLGWGFLLTENLDPMALRRLQESSGGLLDRLRLGLPLSWLSLPLVSVLGMLCAAVWGLSDQASAQREAGFLAGLSLLALRDLALFSWISLRVPVGRQGLARMALAVGIHVFLPVLFSVVQGDTWLVWPSSPDRDGFLGSRASVANLGSLGLQALLAWAILVPASWRRVARA